MIRYRDIIEKRAYSAEQLKTDVGLGGISDKELIGTAAGAALGGVGGSFIPYLWTRDPGRGARLLTALGGALGGGLITNSLMDKERLRNEQYGSMAGDIWRNRSSVYPYAGIAGGYAALSAGANTRMAERGAVRLANDYILDNIGPNSLSRANMGPVQPLSPAVMEQMAKTKESLAAAKNMLLATNKNPIAGVTAAGQNDALSMILSLTNKTPHDARVLGAMPIKGVPATMGDTAATWLYKLNHTPQAAKALILKLLRRGR